MMHSKFLPVGSRDNSNIAPIYFYKFSHVINSVLKLFYGYSYNHVHEGFKCEEHAILFINELRQNPLTNIRSYDNDNFSSLQVKDILKFGISIETFKEINSTEVVSEPKGRIITV